MYIIQSILFKKSLFTLPKAIEWLKSHNFKVVKLDESKDYYRFRQANPNILIKKGFTKFIQTHLVKSGVIYIIAYNEKKSVSFKETKGEGIIQNLASAIKGRPTHLLPPSARALLQKIADEKITTIEVCRRPIEQAIRAIMKFLSIGKRVSVDYDKVFHLFLIINKKYLFEKTEVVVLSEKLPTINSDTEKMNVPINKQITIRELVYNTKEYMGNDAFSRYDPIKSNCQRFVDSILTSNGLNNNQLHSFIVQDVSTIISNLPKNTGRIARFLTDLTQRLNVLKEGEGVKLQSVIY
jgi:hypothetical protein